MEDEVLLFADLCPDLGTIPGEGENSVPAEELDDATKSIEESYKAALANEKRLEESTRGSAQAVKDAVAQGATNADEAWDMLDLDNYPDLDEKSFKKRWNYDMGRDGSSTGGTRTDEPAKPKITLDDVQNMDVSDELKSFVRQLQRTADASEEVIDSVEETVNYKFGRIERFTAQIVSGRFAKKHLMIAGDAGCGKCLSYDEKIPVKMDDAIAEAYFAWEKSRQK